MVKPKFKEARPTLSCTAATSDYGALPALPRPSKASSNAVAFGRCIASRFAMLFAFATPDLYGALTATSSCVQIRNFVEVGQCCELIITRRQNVLAWGSTGGSIAHHLSRP